MGDVLPDAFNQPENFTRRGLPADDQELIPADAVDGLVGFGRLG